MRHLDERDRQADAWRRHGLWSLCDLPLGPPLYRYLPGVRVLAAMSLCERRHNCSVRSELPPIGRQVPDIERENPGEGAGRKMAYSTSCFFPISHSRFIIARIYFFSL